MKGIRVEKTIQIGVGNSYKDNDAESYFVKNIIQILANLYSD